MSSNNSHSSGESTRPAGRPSGDLSPKSAFAKRLQHLAGGGSIQQNADRFGVNRETWRHFWTGNSEPTLRMMEKVIRVTGCSGHWLLTGAGNPYPGDAASRAVSTAPITVPMAGRAAAQSADRPLILWEHEGDPLHIPPTTAHVQVSGASMAPICRDGQSVLIDTSGRAPLNGDLVVVETTEGLTFFKRYYEHGGMVQLTSLNPVEAEPPINLPADAIRRLHIVVGVWYG